ncbi:hypothetical protein ACLB2K_066317 [Fragaria x ananassa]
MSEEATARFTVALTIKERDKVSFGLSGAATVSPHTYAVRRLVSVKKQPVSKAVMGTLTTWLYLFLGFEACLFLSCHVMVLVVLYCPNQILAWSLVAASNVVIHELLDSPKKITEHGVKITEPQEGLRVQDVDAGLLAYEYGWDEEDEDDESRGDAKFTEGEDSEDDDYDPAKYDDDVAAYGVGDDFLFDWLT